MNEWTNEWMNECNKKRINNLKKIILKRINNNKK